MSEIVKTGIEGFDEAFGGFCRGQVIMVLGNAGSGKTTFCAKFLYEGARKFKEPGVFINTIENKKEFYEYMKELGMDFESLEREGLFRYVEILTPTSKDALMNLSKELTKHAIECNAKRIVVDSITPIFMLGPSIEARAILHNALKTLVRELGAVLLITGEMPLGNERIGHGVEEFVVDGIIKLKLEVPEAGAPRRIMEVLKLRGRPLSRAFYDFEIGAPTGFKVYLSGVLEELESSINLEDRINTGVEGIDEMLGGGLVRNTSTLIVGPPGSGKTLFMLTLAAENTLKGERVAFITFEEPRQQIYATLKFLRYDPDELERKGLRVLSLNPRAITMRAFYDVVQGFSRLSEGKGSLLIVDGINSLRKEFGVNFHRVVRDLVLQAKKAEVTVIFSILKEREATSKEALTYLSTLADNIIEFRVAEKERVRREVFVLKARMSSISTEIRELELKEGRLKVR
ncbi:MAG: hypothetical protein DRN06_01295 [Thermoprotei archaeon]|nr:MAG: hypothetical protein DRN06_01295 [Thermoprotei archaeon]